MNLELNLGAHQTNTLVLHKNWYDTAFTNTLLQYKKKTKAQTEKLKQAFTYRKC